MSNDTLIINAVVSLLIILMIWFFGSFHQSQSAELAAPIVILVKAGVFRPNLIQVRAGKPVRLQFLRTDTSPCAGSLMFPQLKASYRLPLNQLVEIDLPALAPGEVDFACPSGLYRGKMMVLP